MAEELLEVADPAEAEVDDTVAVMVAAAVEVEVEAAPMRATERAAEPSIPAAMVRRIAKISHERQETQAFLDMLQVLVSVASQRMAAMVSLS